MPHYRSCPKCTHSPLPEDQALPAACPACGLILAKYGAVLPSRSQRRRLEEEDEDRERFRLSDWIFPVPVKVAKADWMGRCGMLAVLVLWNMMIWLDYQLSAGESGSAFLHLVLTPFHEAGHVIFRAFGNFMHILGGTLGQHLLAIVLGGALLIKRRDAFGAAVFFWLFGYSLIDMAIYMYDAFDPQLTLIGGGTGKESDGHDWQNMFGDLGLIHQSRGIARFFQYLGMVVMALGLCWAGAMLWLQKSRLADDVLDEE